MAAVVLPTGLADTGQALDGEDFSRALLDTQGGTASIGGQLNGFLDLTNFAAGTVLTRDEIGRGQVTQGKIVARTVNCDYFKDIFPQNDTTDDARWEALGRPIPGAGIRFYVPKEARAVAFFWHVSVFALRSDAGAVADPYRRAVRLTPYLDGVAQKFLDRVANEAWEGAITGGTTTGIDMNSRFWSGHWTYEPGMSTSGLWPRGTTGLPGASDYKPTDRGWHTFGVRVSSSADQARIRSCRMGYTLIF